VSGLGGGSASGGEDSIVTPEIETSSVPGIVGLGPLSELNYVHCVFQEYKATLQSLSQILTSSDISAGARQ
jgi:hypothetical protein